MLLDGYFGVAVWYSWYEDLFEELVQRKKAIGDAEAGNIDQRKERQFHSIESAVKS